MIYFGMDYSYISVDIGTYLVKTKIFVKTHTNHDKKVVSPKKKNHTCRWYGYTQSCKISCPNSNSFVGYKNNKFQARKLSTGSIKNLLFLYLTNEFEFGQDILKVYHHVIYMCDFFGEFRQHFSFGLHGFSWRLWFPPDMFPL